MNTEERKAELASAIELAKLQVRYYQSIVDGKPIKIEYRMIGHDSCHWQEAQDPAWFHNCEYREKPVPITTWAVVRDDFIIGSFIRKDVAESFRYNNGGRVVEMVEKQK